MFSTNRKLKEKNIEIGTENKIGILKYNIRLKKDIRRQARSIIKFVTKGVDF